MYLLLTLVILSNCSAEEWIKYTHNNYEISYPKSWIKQQKGLTTLFLSQKENEKDLFQENVNTMVQDLSKQPMTLEEYTNLTKQQITQALGANSIVSIKDLNFAGQQAKEMVYNIPKNPMQGSNLNLKIRQVWFIKDSKAYLITYTAESSEYDNYLGTAKGIFDSFKLKK